MWVIVTVCDHDEVRDVFGPFSTEKEATDFQNGHIVKDLEEAPIWYTFVRPLGIPTEILTTEKKLADGRTTRWRE